MPKRNTFIILLSRMIFCRSYFTRNLILMPVPKWIDRIRVCDENPDDTRRAGRQFLSRFFVNPISNTPDPRTVFRACCAHDSCAGTNLNTRLPRCPCRCLQLLTCGPLPSGPRCRDVLSTVRDPAAIKSHK